MNNLVQFNDHQIELINHNGQAYMTLHQIGGALEYARPDKISSIYNEHKSEFDDEMSCLVKKGGTRVRIFNREGAWLIGMFARTPKAAEFRKWVLKVLGNEAAVRENRTVAAPTPNADLKDWCAQALALMIENRVRMAVDEERDRIAEQLKLCLTRGNPE